MPEPRQYATRADELLPDFCTGPRVVRLLLLSEAVAVILALAGTPGYGQMLERLLLLSVYLQWIGICSAAALCLARRHAWRLGPHGLVAVSYFALIGVTFAITEITFVAGRFAGFAPVVGHTSHAGFVLPSVGISAIVSALALRYFWLRASWQSRTEAEARARLEALQARIEPHFLFNTLNSIASLIAIRPDDAEDAIEDLAALLRARLAHDAPDLVTLDEELTLIESYIRIEKLRLESRLALNWQIAPETRSCPIPTLCLQPLVENAIGHGVARLPEGGTVTIIAARTDDVLHLQVTNPVASSGAHIPGNRHALVNITQRLALRYGTDARLTTTQEQDIFSAEIVIPVAGTMAGSAQDRNRDKPWT